MTFDLISFIKKKKKENRPNMYYLINKKENFAYTILLRVNTIFNFH